MTVRFALPENRKRYWAPRLIAGALLIAALGVHGCAGHWWEAGAPPATPEPLEEPEKLPAAVDLGEAAARAPLLRVGLAQGVGSASVSCGGPLVVSVFADSVSTLPSKGGEWVFQAVAGGISGSGPGGRFRLDDGTIRLRPQQLEPLEFEGVAYRGEIEIFSAGPGSLAVANVVDVESYLRGVVPKEIGPRPLSEVEAVKAQAVAARTYAVKSGGKRAGGSFDVLPTVEDQVYGGMPGESDVCDAAILATAGLILEHGGEPIDAYFHANCGGRTEAIQEVWELGGRPYLVSIWDTPGGSTRQGAAFCFHGPNFTWTESWSADEIEALVREHLASVASTPVRGPMGIVRDLRVTERAPSGRVRWLEVATDAGTYRVFGDRVRWLLRRPGSGRILRSAWFDLKVRYSGGRVAGVEAEGRGYGHGIGMCQHGALEMAREGRKYDEILGHYYRGAALVPDYGRKGESD